MRSALRFLAGMVVLAGLFTSPVQGQDRARVDKKDASLVVEGVVRQVFRSTRQARIDYLVQIDVKRSEGRRAASGENKPHFPGPGEVAYVHLFQRPEGPGLGLAKKDDGYSAVPAERAQIRAYLVPRQHGGWEGVYPDWFEATSDSPAAESPADPPPGLTEPPKDRTTLTILGTTVEPVKVKDRLMFRVKSVERDGPAATAGIEVGDVLAGAKGAAFTSAEQVEELVRRNETLPLIVVDVHSGRTAQVEVRAGGTPAAPKAETPKAETPKAPGKEDPKPTAAPARKLGLSAEPVKVGLLRTALKVTSVEPDGPAAKAGIEVGDILVAANDAPLTGPEQLSSAIRKSGPTLLLTVRDPRKDRDVVVKVNVGGPKADAPLPVDPPEPGKSDRKLGAVTELAFYDTEAAVKVTEVEAGSAAERAGLKPGNLILKANDTLILHPDTLKDVVRRSTGPLKLTVVDPGTGKKVVVEVNPGGGG